MKLSLTGITLISTALWAFGADPDVPKVLSKLKAEKQLSHVELHSLLYVPPSTEIIRALEGAFDHFTEKADRQSIAATLIQIGDREARYFGYLEQFAIAAVKDGAPFLLAYDSEGRGRKDGMNLELEQWCKVNDVDLSREAALQSYDYPQDMSLLAETRDARALPILIEGLNSANVWVAQKSAQGLALQERLETLPLIVKACERFPRQAAAVVATAFLDFESPQAKLNYARFEPNPLLRVFWEKDAVRRHEEYLRQVKARADPRQ